MVDVAKQFAPRGRLRAAINLGNIVLAQKNAATGALGGVTPSLASELAKRLGLTLDLVEFGGAGQVADAAQDDIWDICFLAIDPARATQIDFSPPYVIIEGTYLVRDSSPLREIDQVDRVGTRIAVGEKSAYDLYLTRTVKNAQIVRGAGTAGAYDIFVSNGYEVMAGVRQPLDRLAAAYDGLRVMDGRFTDIRQAMGVPRGRDSAAAFLRRFVEEMKASGFIARALADSGQSDATLAPPEA